MRSIQALYSEHRREHSPCRLPRSLLSEMLETTSVDFLLAPERKNIKMNFYVFRTQCKQALLMAKPFRNLGYSSAPPTMEQKGNYMSLKLWLKQFLFCARRCSERKDPALLTKRAKTNHCAARTMFAEIFSFRKN